MKQSQRAHELRTAREIGAMVIDLLVVVIIAATVLCVLPVLLPISVQP
jgi:hypothetical protein